MIKGNGKKKIRILKRLCRCGRKVTHHHFYCNKCWVKNRERIEKLVPIPTRIINQKSLSTI